MTVPVPSPATDSTSAAVTDQLTCIHCCLPIAPSDLVTDHENGEERHFCCQGCRGAWLVITGAGLDRFYQQRTWTEPGVPEGAYETPYDDDYLARFIEPCGEAAELSFVLEGLRCASCIWLNEKILGTLDGVASARINYATHRARVRYDPGRISPSALFAAVSRLGYLPRPYSRNVSQQLRDREYRSLLVRLGAALFLSMQLMGYSLALYAGFFQGMDTETKKLLQLLAALVATPVVFYCGWPFLTGAWRSVKNRSAGMDLLVATGILAAWGASVSAMFTGGEVYFDTAAMIVTLLLVGRLFENSARRRAASGIDRLLQLAPETAHRLDAEAQPETVASSTLTPGDHILVQPGERFPTDGTILDGITEIDCSAATGEPLPRAFGPDETVLAGTLNLTTAVTVIVMHPAAESFVARVARLVEDAQTRRAPIQQLADCVAGWFIPIVALIAGGSWLFWTVHAAAQGVPLMVAVAVLIIACPCALGLATPTAILVASGAAARRGILFRGGDIIESAARLDMAVFDKTGTLTAGQPVLTEIVPVQCSEEELLTLAASAERGSNHPLATGVLAETHRRRLPIMPLPSVSTYPGKGLSVLAPGGQLLVGSRRFLEEHLIAVPHGAMSGATEIHVALAGSYRGRLCFTDPLRTGAKTLITRLQQRGIATLLYSGDNQGSAEHLAGQLGINEAFGDLSPADKCDRLRQLQSAGHRVLMVGDGINDAPALAMADVGCAMAGGTDIALATSDLVLTRCNLDRLFEALQLADRTLRVIRQNLFWAFAYNVCAIPLAAAGVLAPVHAAIAMTISSVCVVGNSLRLGKFARNG